jgi:predicted Fe-Mo cluster-binding NifX family protein
MSVKSPVSTQAGTISIAIPLAHNRFAPHFGSAEEWMIFEGNPRDQSLGYARILPSPEHKPGALPAFLAAQLVDAVVASSIGERALLMLADAGIITYVADHSPEPVDLAKACLQGKLARANQGNSGCKGECHDHHGHPAHQH